MDYELILTSLRESLETKQAAYTTATDRALALSAEYEKAQAKEASLARDINQTKASIRGIELMMQQETTQEGTHD